MADRVRGIFHRTKVKSGAKSRTDSGESEPETAPTGPVPASSELKQMTLHTGMLPNLSSLIHAGNLIGDEPEGEPEGSVQSSEL
jgi:hypothetical protein